MLNTNYKTLNPKQNQNSNNKVSKIYDLEDRTFSFAKDCRDYVSRLPKTISNIEYGKQLIRSATSIGANYCEANGASSKKDFKNKIFICKKEAKETKYWLRLLGKTVTELRNDCLALWKEAQELTLIFSKIAINTK
jgi:four helix bundle protein